MKTRYGLEIRAAVQTDAPGLSALLDAAGHSVSPSALLTRLDALRQEAGTVLIATAWGPPSGLVALHWYQTLDAARRTARITMLLVDPDERRKGIARLLLKAAAQAARVAGCGALEVFAPPDLTALQAFCRNSGFIPAGASFVRPLRKNGP